jgi:hypothetical protein
LDTQLKLGLIGSPQGEHGIVKAFQSRYSGIQNVRTERESIYDAWNRAVSISRGEYLVNANTDDRHSHEAFARMAATLDARPEGLVLWMCSYVAKVPPPILGAFRWEL